MIITEPQGYQKSLEALSFYLRHVINNHMIHIDSKKKMGA